MTLAELNAFAAKHGVDPADLKVKVWVQYPETTLLRDVTLADAKIEKGVLEIDLNEPHEY